MARKIESEKLLERKLKQAVKNIGGWSIKLLPTFISGLPDQMCLLPEGRVFFAEVKTTGEKPRPVQWGIIKKLQKLGFKVYVIDCTNNIENAIKENTTTRLPE